MYKQDLTLNNLQVLIYHKIHPTNDLYSQFYSVYIFMHGFFLKLNIFSYNIPFDNCTLFKLTDLRTQ